MSTVLAVIISVAVGLAASGVVRLWLTLRERHPYVVALGTYGTMAIVSYVTTHMLLAWS